MKNQLIVTYLKSRSMIGPIFNKKQLGVWQYLGEDLDWLRYVHFFMH